VTGGKYYIPQYAGNCVAYVRALVHMPSKDLTYFQGKKGIINSNKPKKGSVAIIKVNSGDYANIGHVAYVHDVDTSGKNVIIELYEANYPRKGIWKRVVKGKHASLSDLEKRLNIVGYYKP
jgi:surface antigen